MSALESLLRGGGQLADLPKIIPLKEQVTHFSFVRQGIFGLLALMQRPRLVLCIFGFSAGPTKIIRGFHNIT